MKNNQDIDVILEVQKLFENESMAESRNISIYSKESLWKHLQKIPLDCLSLGIPSKRYNVKIPDNLGDFLNNIAGNSLDVAAWILQWQLSKYIRGEEEQQYSALLEKVNLLNALKIVVNNSKKNPDKHISLPSSEHADWDKIFEFYNKEMNASQIHRDINGDFRFKNFPSPKGKRLKKKLLAGRCLLCHAKQSSKYFLCDFHSNKKFVNERHKVERWIRDAYKHLLDEQYTKEHSKLNVFLKSYELHTWAKWHPVHKKYRALIKSTRIEISAKNNGVFYLNPIPSGEDMLKLQKAYLSHPYINEFERPVEFSQYTSLEAYHSIILESEHTIIKVAASSRLRKKYNFTAESIIDYKEINLN